MGYSSIPSILAASVGFSGLWWDSSEQQPDQQGEAEHQAEQNGDVPQQDESCVPPGVRLIANCLLEESLRVARLTHQSTFLAAQATPRKMPSQSTSRV